MPLDVQGTSYLKLPVGTTAQRPTVPASGMIRMNSNTGNPEWYDATTGSWLQFSQPAGYLVNYLVVAGGGGGGGGSSSNSVGPSLGGNGGSGIVIIRYLGSAARAIGGTITITGGYVIHTFTSSGTFIA